MGNAARKRLEVGDREHHPPFAARHPGHFGDGVARPVEVIEGSLADHPIKAVVSKRQRIRPASNPARCLTGSALTLQPCETQHPLGWLCADRPRTPLSECHRVLTEPAGDVQQANSAIWAGEFQGAARHPVEEEFAVAGHPRWDDVAHISV